MRPAHPVLPSRSHAGQTPPTDTLAVRVAALACALIFAIKLILLRRINVNWDEFYFLSHVYDYVRGSLAQPFQTAYVHVFTWLTRVPGNEVAQVVAARALMLVCLGLSVLLIWRLALRWSAPMAAAAAPLAYLAASPVLRHGDAFRADSLLTPLSLAVILLFTRRAPTSRTAVLAGICLGLAIALTVKAVLLAPVLVAFALLAREANATAGKWGSHLRSATGRLLLLAAVAGLLAAALVALHAFTLGGPAEETSTQFATRATGMTLLHLPWFPRRDFLEATLQADLLTWLLFAAGVVAALVRRQYAVVALGLSLLPILFYRNAFPYYYVPMLAPASVLAAVAVDSVLTWARGTQDPAAGTRLALTVLVALSAQAAVHLFQLRFDDQSRQRAALAAVHRIFPEPVPYIDQSGAVASFPKVNFFMSTWGMEEYRAREVGFMRTALEHARPPLLLADRAALNPASAAFRQWLLPEDQRLIKQFYLPYWGPIHVAGAEARIDPGQQTPLELPFPGRYRLDSRVPLLVDGEPHRAGDVITVGRDARVVLQASAAASESFQARLYWAGAREPPDDPPEAIGLFVGF